MMVAIPPEGSIPDAAAPAARETLLSTANPEIIGDVTPSAATVTPFKRVEFAT